MAGLMNQYSDKSNLHNDIGGNNEGSCLMRFVIYHYAALAGIVAKRDFETSRLGHHGEFGGRPYKSPSRV